MKKMIRIVALFALIAAPVAASAEGYIGVGAGQNKMDFSGFSTSTAFSLFGGYAFNEYFAGELAYVNFGSADTSFPGTSVTGNAASLSAVGSLPLSSTFSLFAKLGYASASIEATGNSTLTHSDTNYGIGARYNLSRSVGVRLGYDNFKVGDTSTKDSAFTSIGVLFSF